MDSRFSPSYIHRKCYIVVLKSARSPVCRLREKVSPAAQQLDLPTGSASNQLLIHVLSLFGPLGSVTYGPRPRLFELQTRSIRGPATLHLHARVSLQQVPARIGGFGPVSRSRTRVRRAEDRERTRGAAKVFVAFPRAGPFRET